MSSSDPLIQYIVFRKDLTSGKGKWSSGALISNGAHASVAAIHESYTSDSTKEYLADIDRMHKVTLLTENEDTLIQLSDKLSSDNIQHKLWKEQPENINICLATQPLRKSFLQPFFNGLQLCR